MNCIEICIYLVDTCTIVANPSRPKALKVPTWCSSIENEFTNQEMQLASAHSQLRYQQKPTQSVQDVVFAWVHELLQQFSTSCIGCWLCGKQTYRDHQFKNCRASPSPLTRTSDWDQWNHKFHMPEGFCFKCGCIQKVNSYQMKAFMFVHHVSDTLRK